MGVHRARARVCVCRGIAVQGVSIIFLRIHDDETPPPHQARFRELVEQRFYGDTRFFRVLDGIYGIWIAQFGISGEPIIQVATVSTAL